MTKDSEEDLTWKWRIFWTEYNHARNRLADFDFLGMTPGKKKVEDHYDIYYYLPGTALNIKKREDAIIIKEMRERKGDLCGYVPRKIFPFPVAAAVLPIARLSPDDVYASSEEMLEAFSRHYPGLKVYCLDKKRTSVTFQHPKDDTKKLKAEFSEIRFEAKILQTLCLESKHRKWLRECADSLKIEDGIVSDYYQLLALL